jgi:hypothetical protein
MGLCDEAWVYSRREREMWQLLFMDLVQTSSEAEVAAQFAAINVANGWDGTILECEEMPEDVKGGPMDMPGMTRKLQESGGYGSVDCEDDECGELFDKCGGGYNISTPCCDPDTACVIKNWFYAQCLTEEKAGVLTVSPAQS